MLRVLHIVGKMDMGGQETFIMNLYRNIDRSRIQFDFIVHTNDKQFYEDEILNLGGKVYHIDRMMKNPIKHTMDIKKIVKEGNYKIVHRHTANPLVYADLLGAKQGGAVMRIAHSHNTKSELRPIIHNILRKQLNRYKTMGLACSQEAGQFLFGNNDFTVINNGIDLDKFRYNENIRRKYREELGIENKFVIGHVGRFHEQKNHRFLIEVFAEVLKKEKDAVLLLVGDGELRSNIKEYAEKLNICDNIKFLGVRNDANNIMQAMDVFVFPSLYEGLPVTLIEAQTSGIECIITDNISDETIVSENIHKCSLNDSAIIWANNILKYKDCIRDESRCSDKINEFDIKYVVNKMEYLYNLVQKDVEMKDK